MGDWVISNLCSYKQSLSKYFSVYISFILCLHLRISNAQCDVPNAGSYVPMHLNSVVQKNQCSVGYIFDQWEEKASRENLLSPFLGWADLRSFCLRGLPKDGLKRLSSLLDVRWLLLC